MTDQPNRPSANQSEYLKPWSTITDEELGLLRRIRELCAGQGGEIGAAVARLRALGK